MKKKIIFVSANSQINQDKSIIMAEFSPPKTQEDLDHSFEQLKPYMNDTMAYYESARCLFCYDAPCIKACPTEIDIPLFIRQIHTGNIEGAAKTIYDSNYFGNICGKVCPTEVLCEGACVYNHQDVKPIEIGRLQSFATSQIIQSGKKIYNLSSENGKQVAIIGAGPAGIAAACELRMFGYAVTVFEAKAHPSGLALYGCAPYKITNEDVLEELEYLREQFQFEILYNQAILSAEQLREIETKFDAVLLGIGLGHTRPLQIAGEDLSNSWGATEFIELVKINPLNTPVGKKVVVIGGGNTAMDAASEAARLGAEEVLLVYRRSKEEMGAYEFEYDLAKAVGVKAIFNANPIAILGSERVEGVQFARTQLNNGKLQLIPNSEFIINCDMLVRATGQNKFTQFLDRIDGMTYDAKGKIMVNENYQTSHPKYFAAGDAVNGGAEVVNAAAEGKAAAKGIHNYLSNI